MSKPWSIAQRLLGSSTLWILIPLVFGGIVTSHFLKGPIVETLDRQIERDLNSLIEFTKFSPEGEIRPFRKYYEDRKFNQVKSGWYWQIVRVKDQIIVGRSLSMKGFEIPYLKYPRNNFSSLLRGLGPWQIDLKARQKTVIDPYTGERFSFLVAADPKFFIDAIERVNERVAIAFGFIALALLVGIFLQVRFGLLPLKKIRISLLNIREGSAKKFDGVYPVEIRPLTDELNAHLKYTEETLAKARAEVGNLAHALKTPISVIGNENRKPTKQCQKIIQKEIEKIERHVNNYLLRENATYRHPFVNEVTNVLSVTLSLSNAIKKQYLDRGITIHINVDPSHAFKGSQNDLEEMVGNLLENAGKFSNGNIWINTETLDVAESIRPMLVLTVDDDGEGIPEDVRDEMFSRGKRYDETFPGSGLGLSIVKQISTLYGGSIKLEKFSKGGLRAILTLPRAQET